MLGGALGEILAKLALAVLGYFMARKDLKDSVRGDIANGVLTLAVVANEWKARAVTEPGGGADLRVQPDAKPVPLPGADPDPPRDTH